MLVHAYFSVSIFKVIGAYKDFPKKLGDVGSKYLYEVAKDLGKSQVRLCIVI